MLTIVINIQVIFEWHEDINYVIEIHVIFYKYRP